jgi:hypothetical protein
LPRGCGRRKEGGIYAECGLSKHGKPVEHFLVDPPLLVDAEVLGLTTIGVKLIQVEGVWHIFDIVGAEHYPNVADFVEEVRVMGASRRLAKTLDFAKLTSDSKLVLLHRRAHIDNTEEYFTPMGTWMPSSWHCPKYLLEHEAADHLPAMCAGLWWHDIEWAGTELLTEQNEMVASVARIRRRMPGFRYDAWARPAGIQPQYRLAAFMVLPITNLAVIRAQDGSHRDSLRAAERAHLPVEVCDA